jgi:hypothetical protein
MEAWNTSDTWPETAGWASRREDIQEALGLFAVERLVGGAHRRPMVVSSNGILRFLPRVLLASPYQRDSFKMRTGHLGIVECEDGEALLRAWDVAPTDLC